MKNSFGGICLYHLSYSVTSYIVKAENSSVRNSVTLESGDLKNKQTRTSTWNQESLGQGKKTKCIALILNPYMGKSLKLNRNNSEHFKLHKSGGDCFKRYFSDLCVLYRVCLHQFQYMGKRYIARYCVEFNFHCLVH